MCTLALQEEREGGAGKIEETIECHDFVSKVLSKSPNRSHKDIHEAGTVRINAYASLLSSH